MIEELQRSVVFFSRANATLKQQNDELQRLLFASQARVQAFENEKNHSPTANDNTVSHSPNPTTSTSNASTDAAAASNQTTNTTDNGPNKIDLQAAQQAVASAQAQAAQVAATQALFQNQGFPPAAARAAAQTFAGAPVGSNAYNATVASNTMNPSSTSGNAQMEHSSSNPVEYNNFNNVQTDTNINPAMTGMEHVTITAQQWQQHMQFLAAQMQQQQQQQQQMNMMNWFNNMNANTNAVAPPSNTTTDSGAVASTGDNVDA
jgi:hypothetical protein